MYVKRHRQPESVAIVIENIANIIFEKYVVHTQWHIMWQNIVICAQSNVSYALADQSDDINAACLLWWSAVYFDSFFCFPLDVWATVTRVNVGKLKEATWSISHHISHIIKQDYRRHHWVCTAHDGNITLTIHRLSVFFAGEYGYRLEFIYTRTVELVNAVEHIMQNLKKGIPKLLNSGYNNTWVYYASYVARACEDDWFFFASCCLFRLFPRGFFDLRCKILRLLPTRSHFHFAGLHTKIAPKAHKHSDVLLFNRYQEICTLLEKNNVKGSALLCL